jgi:hypothetical protein
MHQRNTCAGIGMPDCTAALECGRNIAGPHLDCAQAPVLHCVLAQPPQLRGLCAGGQAGQITLR